jgi:hypothetical protein
MIASLTKTRLIYSVVTALVILNAAVPVSGVTTCNAHAYAA